MFERSHLTEAAPKILCIENHSTLRDMMAQMLTFGSNYQVDVAQDGLEGVNKARSWEPDLIIMGLRLPVMDGFEAIKIIRSNPLSSKTPIVVISPWSNASSKKRALDAGANEHITPPVDVQRLLDKIDRYLSQRQH